MDFERFRELPAEEPQYVPEEGRSNPLLGVLTAAILILTIVVSCCYLAVFVNPQVTFNPFKPPTALVLVTPTRPVPTNTLLPTFPPTWTPTASPTHTATPTITPTPTNTPLPTNTPRATNTPKPPPPFYLDGEPIHRSQTLYDGVGSWWLGFAGEVTDPRGASITDVRIKIWDGEGWEASAKPGAALDYRAEFGGSTSWWEQFVPFNCTLTKTFHLQVIQADAVLSPAVKVEHGGSCKENLIIVNFKRRY
jgi:hypothetical protein